MTSEVIFELKDVLVTYGFRRAVDGVSLTLSRGQSLGLLGLNGAGKSSTIRALLGMVGAKQGKIELFGGPQGSAATFRRLGFAPEEATPPEYLSGREYLSFIAEVRAIEKAKRKQVVDEELAWFELEPGKKIRDYSKGMRRRLVLAQAFLGNPELLILDEPLNGLDPLIIIKLRERLIRYRETGGSTLYSSHILTEVEKSCTDVAIMHGGKLQLLAPMSAVLKDFGSVEAAFEVKVKKEVTT